MICKKCGKKKPLSRFYPSNKSCCIDCKREKSREYYHRYCKKGSKIDRESIHPLYFNQLFGGIVGNQILSRNV